MAKKILFCSDKGGVGVTSFCMGVGVALAQTGERVLLVDGDNISANLHTVLACDDLCVYTAADYQKGACRAKQIVLEHPKHGNLHLFSTLNCFDTQTIARAVREVEALFDFILCDDVCPELCDEATVVTLPYASALKSADATLSRVKDGKFSAVGLAVNAMNGGLVFDGELLTPQEIAALLDVKLRAVIPEDLCLPLGKMKRGTMNAYALAAQNYAGKSDKVFNATQAFAGLNGYMRRKLRSAV